jgi:hypothetical protein
MSPFNRIVHTAYRTLPLVTNDEPGSLILAYNSAGGDHKRMYEVHVP